MSSIHIKNGSIEDAIEYIEKSITLISELYLSSSNKYAKNYSSILHLASQIYSNINIEKAITFGEECIKIIDKYNFSSGEIHQYIELQIEYLTTLQFNYSKNNDFDKAIGVGIKSLEKANTLFSLSKEKWTGILIDSTSNLSENFLDTNNTNSAGKLITTAMELCEKEYNKNNSIEWTHKLSKIYYLKSLHNSLIGEINNSIKYCDKAIFLIEIVLNSKCELNIVGDDYIKTVLLLIQQFRLNKSFNKIIDLSNKSIDISEKCFKNNKNKTIELITTFLFFIADSYRKMNDLSNAMFYYHKSLDFFELQLSKDSDNDTIKEYLDDSKSLFHLLIKFNKINELTNLCINNLKIIEKKYFSDPDLWSGLFIERLYLLLKTYTRLQKKHKYVLLSIIQIITHIVKKEMSVDVIELRAKLLYFLIDDFPKLVIGYEMDLKKLKEYYDSVNKESKVINIESELKRVNNFK